MRIGALPSLKLKHLTKIQEYGLYQLVIYENTKSEHIAFCTPESAAMIDSYLEYRKRCGDFLIPESPLIREDFDMDNPFRINKPQHIKVGSIKSTLQIHAVKAGLREVEASENNKRTRKKVPLCNGFRRFADTMMLNSKMNPVIKDMLIDHDVGLEKNYYRPTLNDLLQEYLGPYSKVLFHDICNQFSATLAKVPITADDRPAYFTFRIADDNKWMLQLLTNQIDSSKIAKAREITNQYSKIDPGTFLEQVYKKYLINSYVYEQFLGSIKNAITETDIRLRSYFEGYSGPSSEYLSSVMELLTAVVTNLKDINQNTQRFVVLNLLNEIICKCKEILEYYKPHSYKNNLHWRYVN